MQNITHMPTFLPDVTHYDQKHQRYSCQADQGGAHDDSCNCHKKWTAYISLQAGNSEEKDILGIRNAQI